MASTLFTAGIILGITFLLVSANNLTINEKEEFDHYLIAIDTLNGKVLYLNFNQEEEKGYQLFR